MKGLRAVLTSSESKGLIDLLEKELSLRNAELERLTAEVNKLKVENGQLRTQTKDPNRGALQETMGVLWKAQRKRI